MTTQDFGPLATPGLIGATPAMLDPAANLTAGKLSGREQLYPSAPAGPESILDPLPIDRAVKADAWDAFHATATPEEFRNAMDPIPLPLNAKADLWDMKFMPKVEAPAPMRAKLPAKPAPATLQPPPAGLTGIRHRLSLVPQPPVMPGPVQTYGLPPGLAEPPAVTRKPIPAAPLTDRWGRPILPTPTPGREIAPPSVQIEAPPEPKPGQPLIMPTQRIPLTPDYTTEPTFTQARGMAMQKVSDAVDKNLPFLVGPFGIEKGMIKTAAQTVTDPVTGAIVLGTAGLGAVPGAAARGLEAGLSAYFATKAGEEFFSRFPVVARKVTEGDWQGAAEEGGSALADAIMAYGAAKHAQQRADYLPGDVESDIRGFRERFGPAKPVTGTVQPPIDPFRGVGRIGAPVTPPTFEGQATPIGTEPTQPQEPAQPTSAAPEAQQAEPAKPAKPESPFNVAAFTKAHNVWHKNVLDALGKVMKDHPEMTYPEAVQFAAQSAGIEPQITDYKALPAPPEPPQAPPEPPEAPPPDKVAKVGPGTKNPPTAAIPTKPESPETIALQVQQLATPGPDGKPLRKVVMFPGGVGQPAAFPPGVDIRVTHDDFGNTYAYRGDMTGPSAIHRAANNNTLPELLGHSEAGMGTVDKSQLDAAGKPQVAVVGHAPDGTEAQATLANEDTLPTAVAATHAVTPEGGTVRVVTPEEAVAERQGGIGAPAPITGQGQVATPQTAPEAKPVTGDLVQIQPLVDWFAKNHPDVRPWELTPEQWMSLGWGQSLPIRAGNTEIRGAGVHRMLVDWAESRGLPTYKNALQKLPEPGTFEGTAEPVPNLGTIGAGARIIARIPGPDPDGLHAEIAEHPSSGGYSVAFQDPASGSYLPEARIFPTEAQARQFAHEALGIQQPEGSPAPTPVTRPPVAPPDLTEREATNAAKDLGIDTSGFDRGTIDGRKQLATAIAAEQSVSGVDKSVRDLPVKATVKDGVITAVVRYERKPVATITLTGDEWLNTLYHPNPAYPQRKLAAAKLAETDIAATIDKLAERNERMNPGVVNRLADSVVNAVNAAIGNAAAAHARPEPVPVPEGTVTPEETGVVSNRESGTEGAGKSAEQISEPAIPTERPGEPALEGGGGRNAVRNESAEPLAGIPPENVPRPAEGEPPVQVGNGGRISDGESHAGTLEAGPAVRQEGGDRVPAVVSPAGRKGPAEPDLQPVQPPGTGSDYRLTPEEAAQIDNGGARLKARNNVEAIRTIKQIQAEGNRPATFEEQEKIAKYVGWGDSELAQGIFKRDPRWAGIREELRDLLTTDEWEAAERSTINAHYTRRDIAAAMWDALAHMGFRPGASVIEPGMGIGNFFMMMPENLQPGTSRTGIEMDLLSGAMAKALYPGSNILVKPYQDTNLPNGYFDAAIGNVPFQGNIDIYDPAFKREPYLTKGLHNYFFAKTMEKLRPGGVMIMITSRGTMDSPAAKAFRQWMSKEGEFLGAVRLPRDTFKGNAGTSVTADVIAIRKRVPGADPLSAETWTDSKPHDMGGGHSVDMNEYYHRHPEMMMGQMRPGSMYRENYPELFGTFSPDVFKDLLATLPKDAIPSWVDQKSADRQLAETFPDAQFVKDGAFTIHNGALVRREGAYMKPVTATAARLARAKGLIEIRGAAREVLRAQEMSAPEEVIEAARKYLNEVYDGFVNGKIDKKKTIGPINSNANALALSDDPDWPLLSSLEDYDKTTKTAAKRDIFRVNTNVKPKPVESVGTGAEALAVSLNDLGRLDWDRMQQLTGRTPDELRKELEGKIYRNPVSKRWETADEYLSGNVRQKLADAEFAARGNPELNGNVEALRAVQPRNLPPGEIDAPLGAVWIPNRVYSAFMNELLHGEGGTVKLVPITGGYAIEAPHTYSDRGVANSIEYGTPYFSGMELFEMAMNGISPVARDEVEDFNGNKRMIKNPVATVEAVEKQRRLMDEFSSWLWKDPERAATMADKYNRERNNLKLREFDGSHLTFPGLNRSWLHPGTGGEGDLDPHQKNAAWRIIQSGNTLLAHAVGAGKTLEMITAAMELKRLGLMRKPMFVVPNHLVGQWRDAFLRAYPGAQILVPTKKHFEAKNRARLMSQIATGNYDAVIVGHKPFELLPVKDETFNDFMNEQLEEVEKAIEAAAQGKNKSEQFRDPTTKQLVRRKTQLEEKLKKRANRAAKDTTVTFEELGVDGLFVDEAHAYKNLGYMSMMDRIAGLPNTDAGRSVDMLLKSRYISKLHGNQRGLVFATGTPVSNSLAEIWTMMRYLMPQYLEDEGFDQFDAWAKTFGSKVTNMELAPEGNRMISRTRFADFVNAPELMAMFRIAADVRTKEQLNLPTPAILTGGPQDVVVPASRQLKNYIGLLGERADRVRSGAVKPDEDNMLKISSDGRKASLDMRLVDPLAKEDRNSKAYAAINNILNNYKEFAEHKATQLVFLDLSTPKAEGRKKAVSPVANTGDEEQAAAPETPAAPTKSTTANTAEEPEPEELDLYGEKEQDENAGDTETADEARERFTVYNQIKRQLMAGGIPEHEIAFIHDADTDAKKTALFDKMNAGDVRVLIGSTEKMGAGMNVQTRLIALHHLDAPWRPSDLEQREGRIDRQGNMLWDQHKIPIRIYRYMTEGSFDAFMWQTIVAKARPITRFMNGDPSVRRIEEPAASVLSAEQAMAISSGNPEVREKIILDQNIAKIEILRGAWLTEQASINQTLATLPGELRSKEGLIQYLTDDIATRNADDSLKVNGKEYRGADVRKDGAADLVGVLNQIGIISNVTPINASYHGFALAATPQTSDIWVGEPRGGENNMYMREGPYGGPYFYSAVTNPNASKTGPGYLRADLAPRPLSKKEAEAVHDRWENGEFNTRPIPVLEKPNLRLIAKAHNYPVSVNYEVPTGTIASADNHLRYFEGDLRNEQDNLRRIERQQAELDSKKGQPFRDEEKLMHMMRRQRELAEKLGENKDDVQALAADDEDNPLTPLLKDQTAAMLPEWFPSNKVYVTTAYGTKSPEKVNVINKFFGVGRTRVGRTERYSVIHIPTGNTLASFSDPSHAVAFARQAVLARDWTPDKIGTDVNEWVDNFRNSGFNPPQETPKESVERLVKPAEAENAEQKAGPVSAYTPLKRKLKVPELTRGEKGWLSADIGGKKYSTDGRYMIEGEIGPAAKSPPMRTEQAKKILAGRGNEAPVRPVAFSTTTIDGKDSRLIWFSGGNVIDGRYYDDIVKRFPGATFLSGRSPSQIFIADKNGRRVGVVMPMALRGMQPPDSIKPLLKPKVEGRFPSPRRLPPYSSEAGSSTIATAAGIAIASAALLAAFRRKDVNAAVRDYAALPPEQQKAVYRVVRDKIFANRLNPSAFTPQAQQIAQKNFGVRFYRPMPPPPPALGIPAPIQ